MTRLVDIATRSLLLALVLAPVEMAHAAQPPSGQSTAAPQTVADKVSFVLAAAEEVASATSEMESALVKARGKGDSAAVKWLVSRVTAAQALGRVVAQSAVAIKAAAAAGQDAKVDHEYRKVAIAMSKARLLLAETQRFKQGQGSAPGSTSLQWQEQMVLADPFEEIVIDDMDVSVDPPQVSPFL